MPQFKEIKFNTPAYKEAVKLRYKLLREPLGLAFSNHDLAKESTEIILGTYYKNQLIGTVHLVPNGAQCKLRQMAISNKYQRKGIGKKLLNYTVDIARKKGFKSIILHAREEAIGFYKKSGFIAVKDLFIEVNIPHLKMIKKLF
jgi:predicted GNAT family N-acyltransferase